MGHLAKISKIIDHHRAEAVITCEETCWCWVVEAAICSHSENAKEPSVSADTEGQCYCRVRGSKDLCQYFENGICLHPCR